MNTNEPTQPSRAAELPDDLVESLSDLLASMFLEEWKAMHSQTVTEATVNPPGGIHRAAGASPLPQGADVVPIMREKAVQPARRPI